MINGFKGMCRKLKKFYCEYCRTISDHNYVCEKCGHHQKKEIIIQLSYQDQTRPKHSS